MEATSPGTTKLTQILVFCLKWNKDMGLLILGDNWGTWGGKKILLWKVKYWHSIAQGGNEVTVPGGVQEGRCGTEEHGKWAQWGCVDGWAGWSSWSFPTSAILWFYLVYSTCRRALPEVCYSLQGSRQWHIELTASPLTQGSTWQFPERFLSDPEVKDATAFADCPLLSRKSILSMNGEGLQ